MSLGPASSSAPARRRVLLGSSLLLCAALTACQGTGGASSASAPSASASAGEQTSSSASPTAEPVPDPTITTSVAPGATDVAVDTDLRVTVADGTLKRVRVSASEGGTLPGSMARRGSRWAASELLEPGTTYDVVAVASGAEGARTTERSSFTTADLTLDEQTFASVAPLQGETVGVGMPVIVTFDVAVKDRAAFEKKMTVRSTPQQAGSWHWLNGHEVHWRPKTYWKPGTKVSVDLDVNSVAAGGGVYGQQSRTVDFTVGDAHVYKVNARTHQMRVFSNGTLQRTLPITTGKPGFVTRSGTKVIIEKFAEKRMNSETIGINPDSAEGYDLDDVQYAMRLTYSGEFIHAAPWSVASQGNANVSHGCTGLSTDNARYLFDMSRRGDVVEYTGTDREMTTNNGWGDWNESYPQYRQASALSR